MRISGPGPIPAQALRFFRGKAVVPSFDYRDLWREEHSFAFTVAKGVQVEVLEEIREALDAALAAGQTFREFSRQLTPELQRLGWWGRRAVEDPVTGDVVDAQLGSPRRLATIFRANMRTARAAGQWERAQATKAALPYLLYELGPSREHREEHVQWHGTLLPIDHPWWATHMPPNGWGCKCRVRQVGRAEYERLQRDGVPAAFRRQEIDPETKLPTGRFTLERQPVRTEAPEIRLVGWRNKRTGSVEQVPEGIDPGWDTNPGLARRRNMEALLAGKLEQIPPGAAGVARADLEYYRQHQGA